MRFNWKWFHFIPVLGFYLIPSTVRKDIEELSDNYSGYDAIVLIIICLEAILILVPILILAIG